MGELGGDLSYADLDAIHHGPPPKLDIPPAARWHGLPVPQQDWLWQHWIPMHQTTLLAGDGGIGKSLLVQQLATAVATAQRAFLGVETKPGVVLAVFCEDDDATLHQRQAHINEQLGISMKDLDHLYVLSRIGEDNRLMDFDGIDAGVHTAFWRSIDAAMTELQPVMLSLDPLADLFSGNENIRSHARQFIQRGLTALAIKHRCAVLLTAHPSLSGLASGSGTSGSTAWSNTVRSRLYLENDVERACRVLKRKKANYASADEAIDLFWSNGALAPNLGSAAGGRDEACEEAFLDLLDVAVERNLNLSTSRQGNFAPRAIYDLAGRRYKWKSRDYEKAMHRLLLEGGIELEDRAGGRAKRLVRANPVA